jgi:uncharacterized protein YeeX (DUF496 family)
MQNKTLIRELVLAEIESDKLSRIEMFSDGRPLTEEEEYRVESLQMLSDQIKEGMSSEDINTAFDMYSDYINLGWYLWNIERGNVEEWQKLRKKLGDTNIRCDVD